MSMTTLAKRLGTLLAEKRMTIAVAESCTGGMLGAAITAVAGSSAYFAGGVIAYDNRIKREILKVPRAIIEKYGAVSRRTAIAMAAGAGRLLRTGCAVSVTGVAGPGGGTREKPVGLVYIGIATGGSCRSIECRFRGTRGRIREQAVERGLKEMIAVLSDGR